MRTFGPEREKVARGRRRLHNEELLNQYASPNIRVIKSRMMRWAEYAAYKMRYVHKILVRNLKGRDHLEDLGVDRKIILIWILGENSGKVWTGCIWLRTETSSGLF
jgi:hypothetical protein